MLYGSVQSTMVVLEDIVGAVVSALLLCLALLRFISIFLGLSPTSACFLYPRLSRPESNKLDVDFWWRPHCQVALASTGVEAASPCLVTESESESELGYIDAKFRARWRGPPPRDPLSRHHCLPKCGDLGAVSLGRDGLQTFLAS